VLCAAGASIRMGGIKKEYLPIPKNPLTVLGSALSAFTACPRISRIVIATPPSSQTEARVALGELLSDHWHKRVLFVDGGTTRRASVHNALTHLVPFNPSHVLIHDGARPWINLELIESIIDAAITYGAVIPALPLTETPKELEQSEGGGAVFIKRHLKRAAICAAQTPQGFKFPEILAAHEKAAARETAVRQSNGGNVLEYTDDAEVWGEFVGHVAVIPGDPGNKKITYPEDLRL
ncbi:MAG: 2-C-methyl-D-erythritol 4-phosphate cytidylyltransferase, partial [Treponema sp.]|nr:2-C-methyl-D-erythritol 4-phosphate cytidylyltransferase [Treponema sp.]